MIDKILQQFSFSKLDEITANFQGTDEAFFSEILANLLRGDLSRTFSLLKRAFFTFLFPGLYESRDFLKGLLLLAILSMLLKYLSMLVVNKQVTDFAFLFVYFLFLLFLMDSLEGVFSTGLYSIQILKEFMIALIPTFCLSLSIANGTVSATVNYQILLFLLSGLCYILGNLLLPLSQCYVFLGFMNGLDDKARMKGFIRLLGRGISLGIRICMMAAISLPTLENLMVSKVDGLQKTVVQKMVSSIPGIGDLSDSVTQVFMHCAELIRNGIGLSAIVVLLLLCLNPLLKLFCLSFAMKLGAAIFNFIGLERMAQTLSVAGEGSVQILKITLCCMLMFAVVIAITLLVLGRSM